MKIRFFPLCLALTLSAAWAAKDDLLISFEENEGYRAGSLEGQNGWQVNSANVNRIQIVRDHETGGGIHSAKVTSGNTYANRTLADAPLTEPVIMSIRTKLIPENADGPRHCRVFLSDSSPNRRFGGVSFGIEEQDGALTLFYRDGEERKPLASEHTASPDQFYRFEVNLHIASRTYDLKVYEEGSSVPLEEISGARFRGEIKDINHLMLNGTPGASFDEIRIFRP